MHFHPIQCIVKLHYRYEFTVIRFKGRVRSHMHMEFVFKCLIIAIIIMSVHLFYFAFHLKPIVRVLETGRVDGTWIIPNSDRFLLNCFLVAAYSEVSSAERKTERRINDNSHIKVKSVGYLWVFTDQLFNHSCWGAPHAEPPRVQDVHGNLCNTQQSVTVWKQHTHSHTQLW